jgi:hypothetical protein
MNPSTRTPAELLAELDSIIRDLDAALADAAQARITLADTELEMAVIEASLVLDITGSNETQRKAALTLRLREDGPYQEMSRIARDARTAIWDAERRAEVAKQRCRMLRAALALYDRGEG